MSEECQDRNTFTDVMAMNANAQHVLSAMFCDFASGGFDGDGEGARNMREGFAHLMRLLQRERELAAVERAAIEALKARET